VTLARVRSAVVPENRLRQSDRFTILSGQVGFPARSASRPGRLPGPVGPPV